jgi:molybdate transport system substrate-binding protein
MRFMLLCLALLFGTAHAANNITIAAGAGYKKPLLKLYELFTAESGIDVIPIFGNMRTVISQVESSGRITLAVGDREFLSRTNLFDRFIPVGQGKLVLAWAGTPPAEGYHALSGGKVQRVAQPHPQKAIYGRAATQFLERSGFSAQLGKRLLVTATVPQVSSYLVAKSVDAGFINLTDALTLTSEIGGYTELPAELYDPIEIVIGVVKGVDTDTSAQAFLEYLEGPQPLKILTEAGL